MKQLHLFEGIIVIMMINEQEIKKNLRTKLIGKRIFCYEYLGSTNVEALRLINNSKAQFGDLIIAERQNSGKGQQDHTWSSPEGGIYLSFITVSKVSEVSNLITFASGISCIKAIEKVTSIKANLKWVNDILVSNQKLGGILTESLTRGEISTNVTGIGINANVEIENLTNTQFKPVSLYELLLDKIDLNLLIAEICNYFEEYFEIFQRHPEKIINEWIENSSILDKKVLFLPENRDLKLDDNLSLTSYYQGNVRGINELGHLIVVDDNNNKCVLTSSRNVKWEY